MRFVSRKPYGLDEPAGRKGRDGKRERSSVACADGRCGMTAEELLSRLEGLAEQLEIPIRYASLATEEFPGRGGLCVLRGQRRIIVERTLGCREKARLLARGLAQFDLEGVFLLPAVRQAIENAKAEGEGQDW